MSNSTCPHHVNYKRKGVCDEALLDDQTVANSLGQDNFLPPATKRPFPSADFERESTPKSSLYNLSNDCLTIISNYLAAFDTVRLVKTGDKFICSKLFASVQWFCLVFDESQSIVWPKIVGRFYNLRYLTIEQRMFTTRKLMGNVLRSQLPVPRSRSVINLGTLTLSELPSSLLALKLRGLAVLVDSSAFLTPTVFPNLKVVDFAQTRVLYSNPELSIFKILDALKSFPTLVSLTLPLHTLALGQEFMSEISPTINKLSVGRLAGGTSLGYLSTRTLHLQVHFSDAAVILPTMLTTLKICTDANNVGVRGFPQLPLSLTRFNLHANISVLEQCFSNKQPVLSQLSCFEMDCTSDIYISSLLTLICRVMPNVLTLKFSDKIRLYGYVDLSILPRSLQQLSSSFLANSLEWKNIPKSCRIFAPKTEYAAQAKLTTRSISYIDDMPNVVESIVLDLLTPTISKVLPTRSWDGLVTVDATLNGFDDKFFESLPCTITKLRICTSAFVTMNVDTFNHLRDLSSLRVIMVAANVDEVAKHSLPFFDTWISYLPKHLAHLCLDVKGDWPCSTNNFSNCVWPEKVRELDLRLRDCQTIPVDGFKESVLACKYLVMLTCLFENKLFCHTVWNENWTRPLVIQYRLVNKMANNATAGDDYCRCGYCFECKTCDVPIKHT